MSRVALITAFVASFALALALTEVVRRLALRYGRVAPPRQDRWHQRPTPLFGGAAIFAAIMVTTPLILRGGLTWELRALLIGATVTFLVSLVDDVLNLPAYPKLFTLLIIASTPFLLGIGFTRVAPYVGVPLTLVWVLGITNAFNFLDNMDGLTAGVGAIGALVLATFFWMNGAPALAAVATILAGASLGFLVLNFNPAKIFMGDAGSHLIGYVLAVLGILGTSREIGNLLLTLLFPALILAVPIFDTTMVTVLRRIHGLPVTVGGKDHSSHRLVALGLSERQAVLYLYLFSAVSGVLALLSSGQPPLVGLVLFALVALVFIFFGVWLGAVKVYQQQPPPANGSMIVLSRPLMYKRRTFQVLLDILLTCIAYTSAYLLRYEGVIGDFNMGLIARSLPLLIPLRILALAASGVYQGSWRYVGLLDILHILRAIIISSFAFTGTLFLLTHLEGYSRAVFIIDGILTFLLISGSRLSLRMFAEYVSARRVDGRRVLILGAGDEGALVARVLLGSTDPQYRPLGFLGVDGDQRGSRVLGLPVLGTIKDIEQIIGADNVHEVIQAVALDPEQARSVEEVCRAHGVAFRRAFTLPDL